MWRTVSQCSSQSICVDALAIQFMHIIKVMPIMQVIKVMQFMKFLKFMLFMQVKRVLGVTQRILFKIDIASMDVLRSCYFESIPKHPIHKKKLTCFIYFFIFFITKNSIFRLGNVFKNSSPPLPVCISQPLIV